MNSKVKISVDLMGGDNSPEKTFVCKKKSK